jgi:hypothetical protein
VRDALPLLRQAESVMIVEVCEGRGSEEAAKIYQVCNEYIALDQMCLKRAMWPPSGEIAEGLGPRRGSEGGRADLMN